MKTVDLNGDGSWSYQALQERYVTYCNSLGIQQTRALSPPAYSDTETQWLFPVLDAVIGGIVENDSGCIQIGVELVESDQRMPFGRRLKYGTARALRRCSVLTVEHRSRLRRRIVSMLISGTLPPYFAEYYRLLRTVGVAELWPELDACVPREHTRAMHYYEALRTNDRSRSAS